MRVIWVVYDHRPPETIAVLGRQVTVIPEGTSLVGRGKIVQERVVDGDGALSDHGHTIIVVRALLEEAVPVLWGNRLDLKL